MFIVVSPSMSFDSSWVNVLKYLCLHKNKIPSETGSLHDQTGPERCLSISCNSSSIPEIPTLHLEKQDLPVQVTPFRTEYRPVGVHSVIKTSSSLLKKTRYQSSAIPRRHAYHWISLLRDSTVHTNYYEPPGVPRLYYKPGEVDSYPHPDNHFSGLHNQLYLE